MSIPTRCWFCMRPAVTVGYGFAICEGRAPNADRNCSERARDLYTATLRDELMRARGATR